MVRSHVLLVRWSGKRCWFWCWGRKWLDVTANEAGRLGATLAVGNWLPGRLIAVFVDVSQRQVTVGLLKRCTAVTDEMAVLAAGAWRNRAILLWPLIVDLFAMLSNFGQSPLSVTERWLEATPKDRIQIEKEKHQRARFKWQLSKNCSKIEIKYATWLLSVVSGYKSNLTRGNFISLSRVCHICACTYCIVVSWMKGLRVIGWTINNVVRKPKCRQAHQCIVRSSIE